MQFSQTDEEVSLSFPLPDGCTKRDLKVTIKSNHLSILAKNETLFNDELLGKVDVDESNWQLDRDRDTKTNLTVTLAKLVAARKWRCAGKHEAEQLEKSMKEQSGSLTLKCVNDLNPDDTTEDAEKNEHDERVLEAEFLALRRKNGLDSRETLEKFFQLFYVVDPVF